jgi:hypothetical protein
VLPQVGGKMDDRAMFPGLRYHGPVKPAEYSPCRNT